MQRIGRPPLHGMSGSSEYLAWIAMRARCENPDHQAYADYGARGIIVDPAWSFFEVFFADMGPRPEGFTLERKNNALGYGPTNCVWATYVDQNRNRRNTVTVQFRGESRVLAELCAGSAIGYSTVHRRIFRMGWDAERALRQPSQYRRRLIGDLAHP